MHTALLGFGSNIGHRLANIQQAITLLTPDCFDIICSPIYETDPVGYTDQPAFLNMVASIRTSLAPDELFIRCKEIEQNIGRIERPRWHEREIDIDILLYSDWVYVSEYCSIPHPRMHERRFVIEPSAIIAPTYLHPVLQKTIHTLLLECTDTNAVRLYCESL
jgi:2-amino-4-hydroxy-6-hydroxymethyldihydropteridine diphosphokinase